MKRYYLDSNATMLLDPRVRQVMENLSSAPLGNPSSLHAEGRRARAAIDLARDTVAAWLQAKPSEIIFTSGGTESNNLAVQGLALAHQEKGNHLITCQTEHHAVLHAFQKLEKRDGFNVTYLPVDSLGRLDPSRLADAIGNETTLVSIMSANNETGVLHPMAELGRICQEKGVIFHTDAVQSAGKISLQLAAWGVSALSLTAHKFCGPVGAGVLWLKAGIPLARLQEGGAHENERRPGTENTVAIAGLAEAVRLFGNGYSEAEQTRQFQWTEKLALELQNMGGVKRNGDPVKRMANTLNLSFEGVHGEEMLMALDLEGISVSSGSACLVGSVLPSHVLAAMEPPSRELTATVRFSIGSGIQDGDLPEIVQRASRVIRHQRDVRGWTPNATKGRLVARL